MNAPDPRIDRLNHLLPAVYRIRDTAQQYPLQALLRVIAEQVNVVEDDISQLYRNWFIETCEDWVVPYIGDLIGYTPVAAAGLPSNDTTAEGRALNRFLIPRREVANTIRCRRRKGTLAVLDLLARDVAGWPARAVEFYRLAGWNQNLNHQHPERGRTVDVRHMQALDLMGGPFDRMAYSANVRRIDSNRRRGRHNIPSVGVFVWRLNVYSLTQSAPCRADDAGLNRYTFSVLGQDTPLYIQPATTTSQIPGELNLPGPIRRLGFHENPANYYGAGKSLALWTFDPAATPPTLTLIPLANIVAADLSDWQYVPTGDQVAVDPVLGRFCFAPERTAKKHVRVSYHYAFSASIGGGEYDRPITQPANAVVYSVSPDLTSYAPGTNNYKTIMAALNAWTGTAPRPPLVIEIVDSGVYTEQLSVTLQAGESLQIRGAANKRPTLRLLDWQNDASNSFSISMAEGSRLTLDGLLVMGRSVQVTGPQPAQPADPSPAPAGALAETATGAAAATPAAVAAAPSPGGGVSLAPICGSSLIIRHCTLVPGWGIDCNCQPQRPAELSLELTDVRAQVSIQHTILGTIEIQESERTYDPIPVSLTDSILDSADPKKEALGSPGLPAANATLTIKRCTVFGIVNVHAIELAENCIFNNCLNVVRRQLGCMRFCSVPPQCRTPRRYECQPDLVVQAVRDGAASGSASLPAQIAAERLRVKPQFTSVRYGAPGYCQLGSHCAVEITGGADDESEMGVFHDLFQPQRETSLITRLNDYTPAGMDVAVIHAT